MSVAVKDAFHVSVAHRLSMAMPSERVIRRASLALASVTVWFVAGPLTSAEVTLRAQPGTTRTVYISAVDVKGEFVTDLVAGEVTAAENGQVRAVTGLAPATERCHVAVLVDDGGDGLMQAPVAELLNAAAGRALFSVSILNPQSVRLTDYTASFDVLQSAVSKIRQRGRLERDPVVLADAVSWTARDMQKRKLSRPVIVIMTNGGDSTENEIAKGILADLSASGASLHLVHVVAVPLGEVFVEGPIQSGGSSSVATGTAAFSRAMTAIATTLAHQYKLTYVLPTGVRPAERLRVTTTRPQVKIVAPTRIANRVP